LEPAPAPRRFSAFLASLFAAGSAVCLSQGAPTAALVLEAILLLAVVLIVSVRFCLGSFVYHTIRGRLRFAIRTLPWGPDEEPSPTSPSGDGRACHPRSSVRRRARDRPCARPAPRACR